MWDVWWLVGGGVGFDVCLKVVVFLPFKFPDDRVPRGLQDVLTHEEWVNVIGKVNKRLGWYFDLALVLPVVLIASVLFWAVAVGAEGECGCGYGLCG